MNNPIITLDPSAICIVNNQVTTSSIKVAENFGKQHHHLIQKIEKLDCSEEFRCRNFSLDLKVNHQNGNSYNVVEMTKDGFMFLVMGFTGKKAAAVKEAYINAFNQMALVQSKVLPRPSKLHQLIEKSGFNLDNPRLFSMVVDSDAMAPTYRKGDIVIANPNFSDYHDGIYIVRFGNSLKIHRVQLLLNVYYFSTDNSFYPAIEIPIDNLGDVSLIGRIEWVLKRGD